MGIEKMIDTMTWNGEKGLGVSPSFTDVYPLFPRFHAYSFVRARVADGYRV